MSLAFPHNIRLSSLLTRSSRPNQPSSVSRSPSRPGPRHVQPRSWASAKTFVPRSFPFYFFPPPPHSNAERPSSFSSDGAPTISAAIALLYEMTVYLNAAIDRVREISGKLAQPSSLGSEEIEDIVLASGIDLSTRYSSSQRHQLALQSLSRSRKATRQQSLSALCSLPFPPTCPLS